MIDWIDWILLDWRASTRTGLEFEVPGLEESAAEDAAERAVYVIEERLRLDQRKGGTETERTGRVLWR